MVGQTISHYRITSELGRGGMGVVYEAEDLELGRLVALKFLPDSPTHSASAADRFRREARAAASLSHPNICTIHDIGQYEGRTYIVMERLVGQTLVQRLGAGTPIRVRQAIEYAIGIADALEAAHSKGLIHRDIKPGNLFLTERGEVKVLDFGLAKWVDPDVPGFQAALTEDLKLTRTGAAVGTAAYMAPEQARGEEVDARADLFSLGAVLYEMVTGRQAFAGATSPLVHDALLNRNPVSSSQLNPQIPLELDRIAARALEKDRALRYQSARDLQIDLKRLLSAMQSPGSVSGIYMTDPATMAASAPPSASKRARPWVIPAALVPAALVPAALVGAALAAVLATVYFKKSTAPDRAIPFQVVSPPGTRAFRGFASPDGKTLAFAVISKENKYSLWVRPMDTLALRQLPGTESAHNPVWSPDSRFLVFAADQKLKRMDINGGMPQVICDAPGGGPVTWTAEGEIVFDAGGPIRRVPASSTNGASSAWLEPNRAAGETNFYCAGFFPDHRRLLYSGGPGDKRQMSVASLDGKGLDGKSREALFEAPGLNPTLVADHLFYLGGLSLMARPFDSAKVQLTGQPQRLAELVDFFSISDSGALVWSNPHQETGRVSWLGDSGQVLNTAGKPAAFNFLSMSADGRRAAVGIVESGKRDIWTLDLESGVLSQLTFSGDTRYEPVWAHDGSKVFFSIDTDLYSVDAHGGTPVLVLKNPRNKKPMDTTPDGRFLIYQEHDGKVKWHIWALDLLQPESKPIPVTWSAFNEGEAKVSPDGHWIAYDSEESGIMQTYIKPFPPTERRWQVSVDGGMAPRWRADGRRLYYLHDDRRMMSVDLKLGTMVEASKPRELFAVRGLTNHSYDVSTDGKRFLMVLEDAETPPTLNVIANWRDLLPPKQP